MFKNDSNQEYYERKYEAELIDLLEKCISKVDERIRRSMNRIEAPMPESYAKSITDKFNQLNDMRDNTFEAIANLNEKINLYLEKAEKKGEEGLIDESEALFKEIEKMKAKKTEMESALENNITKKQMKVCEICGAMQSATDTDKRLTTHLEGKLHQGFAKIRDLLAELKLKREEYKKKKEQEGRKERTPSPKSRKRRRDQDEGYQFDPNILIRNYSSSKLGTGANMPESDMTSTKYANSALEFNKNSIGVPVVAPDFKAIQMEKERKRIEWEKEHGSR